MNYNPKSPLQPSLDTMELIDNAALEFGMTPRGRDVSGVKFFSVYNAGFTVTEGNEKCSYYFQMNGNNIDGWCNYDHYTDTDKHFLNEFAAFITAKTGILFPCKSCFS